MEYKKLGEIADIFTGARISRYQKGNMKKQPVIKRTLSDDYQIDYEMEDVSIELNSKFYSKKDDILVLLAGSNTITKMEHEGYIIPMAYAIVRVKEGYDPDFVYHLLKSEIFPRELNKLIEGSTLKIIKTSYLQEMKLPLIEYEKQKEYGKILRLMDCRIKLLRQTIQLEEELQKKYIDTFLMNPDNVDDEIVKRFLNKASRGV